MILRPFHLIAFSFSSPVITFSLGNPEIYVKPICHLLYAPFPVVCFSNYKTICMCNLTLGSIRIIVGLFQRIRLFLILKIITFNSHLQTFQLIFFFFHVFRISFSDKLCRLISELSFQDVDRYSWDVWWSFYLSNHCGGQPLDVYMNQRDA